MTLEQLVPSLDLCQQLRDKGFPQDTAMVWVIPIGCMGLPIPYIVLSSNSLNHHFKCVAAPTAGELEEWLMTKWPFSKRMSSIVIEWVLLHVKDKEATYRVTSMGIGGLRIIVGKASIVAALADLVLEVAG